MPKQKLPKLKENDIKRQTKQLLDLHDIWNFPLTQSLGSYKGLPDRIAVHKGVVFAIELKRPGGRQSEHQERFQRKWMAHYGNTYICSDDPRKILDFVLARCRAGKRG